MLPHHARQLETLRRNLEARTIAGAARKGYGENVKALKAEIAALEAKSNAVDTDPAPA